MKKNEDNFTLGKSMYTFQDWLDGKLDGIEHWTTPVKGQEPFPLNATQQLPDEEYQKILQAQFDAFDKAVEMNVSTHLIDFKSKLKNYDEENVLDKISREIEHAQGLIDEQKYREIEKAEMSKRLPFGFDSKYYHSVIDLFKKFQKYNGRNLPFTQPTYRTKGSDLRLNINFKLHSWMKYIEELQELKKEYEPAQEGVENKIFTPLEKKDWIVNKYNEVRPQKRSKRAAAISVKDEYEKNFPGNSVGWQTVLTYSENYKR